VSIGDVARMLGVGRSRAYELSKRVGFPEPVGQTPRMRLWAREDVEEWIRRTRPEGEAGA
jgi:predicted DNA-binding transcriptional regulator AlpA